MYELYLQAQSPAYATTLFMLFFGVFFYRLHREPGSADRDNKAAALHVFIALLVAFIVASVYAAVTWAGLVLWTIFQTILKHLPS